jgi:hypothetical protein
MRNTNTKIWFLLLAAGTLLCAGCATETAQQRDQRITRTLQGFELQAQHMVEIKSGKARKDWGPAETAEYNGLFLQALQYWREAEQEGVARRQAQAAMIASGFQNAGAIIAQGGRSPYTGSAFTTRTGNSEYTTFSGGGSAFTTHTGNSSYTTYGH